MKKFFLLAAFGILGVLSAENTKVKAMQTSQKQSVSIFFYNPIRVTSSCGYTEFIDLGGSPIECLEVEMARMEEDCYSPFESWGYA